MLLRCCLMLVSRHHTGFSTPPHRCKRPLQRRTPRGTPQARGVVASSTRSKPKNLLQPARTPLLRSTLRPPKSLPSPPKPPARLQEIQAGCRVPRLFRSRQKRDDHGRPIAALHGSTGTASTPTKRLRLPPLPCRMPVAAAAPCVTELQCRENRPAVWPLFSRFWKEQALLETAKTASNPSSASKRMLLV